MKSATWNLESELNLHIEDHVFFEFSAAQPDSSDVLSEIALNARPSQHALVGCACGQNLVCMLNFSWQVLRGSAHEVHLLYVNDFLSESALAIVQQMIDVGSVIIGQRNAISIFAEVAWFVSCDFFTGDYHVPQRWDLGCSQPKT